MYYKFYGFKEPPFNLTPNSKYFFSSSKHMEALSTLQYAIEERKGFVVVTGDIGAGKTTVCRALLNKLDPANTKTALITHTRLNGKELLMEVLDDFEIDYSNVSKAKLHSHLNDFLIEQLRRDRNVVLIIDEAQNLSTAVLEEVRLLSNLETENEKLIQILFLGQPELKQKLASPKLEQLRQRIAVYYHLTPLNKEDTVKYIVHRLNVASESDKGSEIFSEDVLDLIYEFTKGVPRMINQICDSVLLTGYVREMKKISVDLLREVIEESPMVQIGSLQSTKNKLEESELSI